MSPVQRGERHDATPSSRADRPGREPEGASFNGRIDRRRGGPPTFLIAFGLLLGGVVAIAIAGRAPAPGAGGVLTPSRAAASSPTVPTPAIAPVATEGFIPSRPFRPGASPGAAPVVSSDVGGPIWLQLRRHPETMFVHGDVYPEGVTWVFVALIDDAGRVAGWTSVSVPGGAGVAPDGRPSLRFDVELAMPDWATARLWVQATAYDGAGAAVGTERLGIEADGSPVIDVIPLRQGRADVPAARPGVFFPLLDTGWNDLPDR